MIGKFLEEEKNADAKSETDISQAQEKNTTDVFSLPQNRDSDSQHFEAENQIENNVSNETNGNPQPAAINLEDYTVAPPDAVVPANIQTETKTESPPPETTAETVRKTGLAWSAATVLGGSVVFMMIVGWFFDLVFGSKPWGIVGGIILGAIVGFIQFFRITSRIFKDEGNTSTGILDHKD